MTWFTWRQFRTRAWFTVAALAVLGVILVVIGRSIADAYAAAVAACRGDCAASMRQFVLEARNGTNGRVYNLTTAVMYAVPALIGVFWGAPQFARELETGTHYLAWNQSVTRTRWLANKLAVIGTATVATAGLLSLAVTLWAQQVDRAAGDRIVPLVYGARGIVPIGWAVFAFVLGVTVGMLIRRTVPAMVTTLAVYIVAVSQMPRPHLVPANHITTPLDTNHLQLTINETGLVYVDVSSDIEPRGAWVLFNQAVTPTGKVFSGHAYPQHCTDVDVCREWIGTLGGLHQEITYHPGSHFWPLQWTEAGIFLAVAALLAGFCFWWTRRRLT
jgi:hypothetical protein